VDVQIILATNRKLEEEVAAKRFREDLYYRVNGLQVELAPLRDPRRTADIRPLLAHYLAWHERALSKKTMGLTRDALRSLLQFSWPGNVRQLSNVCSCLVTHAPLAERIDAADIRRLRPDVLSDPKSPHREAHIEGEDTIYSAAHPSPPSARGASRAPPGAPRRAGPRDRVAPPISVYRSSLSFLRVSAGWTI
jgi:transcriptional regulator with PAS, ATPase and Fis domain